MDEIQELAKVLLIETGDYTNELIDELIVEVEDNEDVISSLFYDHFNITLDDFEELLPHLTKLIDIGRSISGNLYKGFGKDNIWLYKIKIKENEV